MTVTVWWSFVLTVTVLVISPGPSVMLASAHGVQYGSRRTVGTICGDLSANVLQMLVAAIGLAVLVELSAELLSAIKWVGVAYLIVLGVRKLLSRSLPHDPRTPGGRPPGFWGLYLRGFVVSAANPKAVVFFASLFPLYLDPRSTLAPQFALLMVTFVLLDGLALSLYARCGHRLRGWLARKNKLHWENRLCGGLLIGAGCALMLKRVRS